MIFFRKIVPYLVYFGQDEDFKLTTELFEKVQYSHNQAIKNCLNEVNNVSHKWRLGAQCSPPQTTHEPQPGEVHHPSDLPYPHQSHEPPQAMPKGPPR